MDFDTLQDLVRIVTKNKIKNIEVLGNEGASKTKVAELYDGLSKGKWVNEEAIMAHFFGDPRAKPQYNKLKNRLVQQLVNTSFFIDAQAPLFQDINTAFLNCHRHYAAAHILLFNDGRKAGVYLLQTTLEQAIKYEFIDLCADISRVLRKYYLNSFGDRGNYEKYTQLYNEYENKRHWENLAVNYLDEFKAYYISFKAPTQEVYDKAEAAYSELSPMIPVINTTTFLYSAYQIGVIRYFAKNDACGCIDFIEEALAALAGRESNFRGTFLGIAIQKLACEIQLKIKDNLFTDKSTAKYCLFLTNEGQSNWFKVLEMQYYQYLHTGHYQQALEIYLQATAHPRFNLLEGGILEDWKLFGGYLQLLAALGKLDQHTVNEAVGAFRTNKFLNEFNVLAKDKQGMNIPVILLPVLFSIVQKDYDNMGKTREALIKYRQRYMEKAVNHRSSVFIDILLLLADMPYTSGDIRPKLDKKIRELSTTAPDMIGQSFAVEIVPYEELAEMLFQSLRGSIAVPDRLMTIAH